MKRDNHYVPRSYLKRWAADDGKLWSYRVLVSHPDVPLWRRASTRGIGYHEHLYTRIAATGESDDLERWLDAEFEAPAEEAIEKVVSNRRLTPTDWRRLARFFAAQDVRTPARFVENLDRWSQSLPTMIQDVLQESVARLETMSDAQREQEFREARKEADERTPFRVTVEKRADGDGGWVRGETIAGRNLWIWSIRQLLTNSSGLRALETHRWTILTPPEGVRWCTSDDPVLKVNFNSLQDYNFGGGWGSVGTDLLLPLGPHHLLFTQVGKRVPARGTPMDAQKAYLVQRFTAERAHRYVFADAPDSFIPTVRPRTVNAAELARESDQWKRWHAEQSSAERDLMGWQSGLPSSAA